MSTSPPPTAPPPPPGMWADMKAAAAVFLPTPLQKAVADRAVFRGLAMLVMMFVVAPVVFALLAGFWLRVLSGIELGTVKGLRQDILGIIQEGFSVEEVASRSHARLDYFQQFQLELDMKRQHVIQVGLQQRQLMRIDVRRVALAAGTAACNLPEEDFHLLEIRLEGERIATLERISDLHTVLLDQAWWDKYGSAIDRSKEVLGLSFHATPEARKHSCAKINVEGGVRVFKNVFQARAKV